MEYSFVHLRFLKNRSLKGDRLTNEDYVWLTEMRAKLSEAVQNMNIIDESISAQAQYC